MMSSFTQKTLPQSEDNYIVSYISLGHKYHCLLAISKKVGEHYYLVNSIGLMQVNTPMGAHSDSVPRDIRAVYELIRPSANDAMVYAKHYAITNDTAKNILSL